jgi:uncharacterized protein YndB with AHSA1/START domain
MRFLKIFLIGLASIIVLILVILLFTKKEYAVEREIVINKPNQEVFDYIKYLKNQDNFSVWAQKDPNMKKTYTGTDGTVGFISAWDSNVKDVGVGEQEIKKITEGERLDFELRFKKPFEATDNAFMTTEAMGENQTKVKWGFFGKMKYPMNGMLLMMDMDKMLGGQLQTGLDNLKNVLEK